MACKLRCFRFGATPSLHFTGYFLDAAITENGKSNAQEKNDEEQIVDLPSSIINCELEQYWCEIIEVLDHKNDDAKKGYDNDVQCRWP